MLPNTNETLRPAVIGSGGVWLQRDVNVGDKSDAKQTVFPFTMTTNPVAINHDKDGNWSLTTGTVDYTKGRYAQSLAAKAGKDGQTGATGASESSSQPQASGPK